MLPGGGIDEGEIPMVGTNRELMEELGIILKRPLRLISEIHWDLGFKMGKQRETETAIHAFSGE